MPSIAYANQHIDIEIPHGSRDHVIVPDPVKTTFKLDIESTNKTQYSKQCRQSTGEEKMLMLGSKDIDTINNSDIYDMYKDLYLTEKDCEEKLLQDIHLPNDLKARVGAKKADDTALTETTQENAIKRGLIKGLHYLQTLTFSSILYIPTTLKKI